MPLQGYYSEALLILATAKKNSFHARVECVGMNPGKQSKCQWKPIPNGGANRLECTGLHCRSMGKRDKEYPVPLRGGSCDLWYPGLRQQ